MNFRKNSKGITLVALVVTIIVLLILAGVSLSLVAGGDGILGKAGKAVDETNKAKLKEEVELALANLKTDYYQERYVDRSTDLTYPEYVKEKLEDGLPTSDGTLTLEDDGEKVDYTPTGEEEPTATGTFDEETGVITIPEGTIGGSEDSAGESEGESLSTQITADNYGEYVDLKTNYVRGNLLKTGTATEDWRIFYKDGTGGVYLILADYLPYAYEVRTTAGSFTGLGTGLSNEGGLYLYNWRSTTSRTDLIDRLEDSNAWNKLLSSTYIDKGITVKGAVDLETWVASWNAKGYTKLYTNTYFNENNSMMDDDLDGYYIGTSEDTTSTSQSISSDTAGYGDTLYFQNGNSKNWCFQYFLDTPSACHTSTVMSVDKGGMLCFNSFNINCLALRPVVYLPSNIKAVKNESGVWEIK